MFSNLFLVFILIVIVLFIVGEDVVCRSKKNDKEVVEKHNLLISCGFNCSYNTSIKQYVWEKDERIFFDDDLKYLTLKELEEIIK